MPAIWFHPGTRRLHVRDGQAVEGDAGCDPEIELTSGVETTVRVEIRPGLVEVWLDDVLFVCALRTRRGCSCHTLPASPATHRRQILGLRLRYSRLFAL